MRGATETALTLPEGLSLSEWAEVGENLGRANRASAWWVGDWVNYGEDVGYTSRAKYDEAERITGLSGGTLRIYAHVARRFQIVDRINDLTFAHHRLVAPIETQEERSEILALAAAEDWGRDRLRAHLSHATSPEPLGVVYGKGDKWHEATEPLARYLTGWEKRGYEFRHLNPREAGKRVARIDQLIAGLTEARADLERRSHRAKLTL